METRLMKTSLPDYTRVMRGRYARRWGKRARGALLDEHCQSTGLERKYANEVPWILPVAYRTGLSWLRFYDMKAGLNRPGDAVPCAHEHGRRHRTCPRNAGP